MTFVSIGLTTVSYELTYCKSIEWTFTSICWTKYPHPTTWVMS